MLPAAAAEEKPKEQEEQEKLPGAGAETEAAGREDVQPAQDQTGKGGVVAWRGHKQSKEGRLQAKM